MKIFLLYDEVEVHEVAKQQPYHIENKFIKRKDLMF